MVFIIIQRTFTLVRTREIRNYLLSITIFVLNISDKIEFKWVKNNNYIFFSMWMLVFDVYMNIYFFKQREKNVHDAVEIYITLLNFSTHNWTIMFENDSTVEARQSLLFA